MYILGKELNFGSSAEPAKDDRMILKRYPNARNPIKNPMIIKRPRNARSFIPKTQSAMPGSAPPPMIIPKTRNFLQSDRGYLKASCTIPFFIPVIPMVFTSPYL